MVFKVGNKEHLKRKKLPIQKRRELVDGKLFCPPCGSYKGLEEFHNCKGATFGKAYHCKTCVSENGKQHHKRYVKENPLYRENMKRNYIKRIYGISLEEYRERLAAQNYECAICKVKLLTSGHLTHLDHSHKTGKVRAFLCTNCNRGLGHFQDNPELLQKAKDYLDAHTTNVDSGKGETIL